MKIEIILIEETPNNPATAHRVVLSDSFRVLGTARDATDLYIEVMGLLSDAPNTVIKQHYIRKE